MDKVCSIWAYRSMVSVFD